MASANTSIRSSQVDLHSSVATDGGVVFTDGYGLNGIRREIVSGGQATLVASPGGTRSCLKLDNLGGTSGDSANWAILRQQFGYSTNGMQNSSTASNSSDTAVFFGYVYLDVSAWGSYGSNYRAFFFRFNGTGASSSAQDGMAIQLRSNGGSQFDQVRFQYLTSGGSTTSDSTAATSGAAAISTYFGQWCTMLVEYQKDSGSGDGVMRLTMGQGRYETVAELEADAADSGVATAGVIHEVTNGTNNTTLLGCQLIARAVTYGHDFSTYWETFALGDGTTDPYIIQQQLLGQLVEADDSNIGVFVWAPPGLFDNSWDTDSVHVAIKYGATGTAEGTWSTTDYVELLAADLYCGCVKVTGISPGTTNYSMRVLVKENSAGSPTGTAVESDHLLTYTAPTLSMKGVVTFCARNTGASKPYGIGEHAISAGCNFIVNSDDVGYSDRHVGSAGTDDVTYNDFLRTQLEYMGDQGLSLARRQMVHISKPGDHQWQDEFNYPDRSDSGPPDLATLYTNGRDAWCTAWGDGQMGLLSYTGGSEEFFRVFDWGPYCVCVIQEPTQEDASDATQPYQIRDAAHPDVHGGTSEQMARLKTALAATTKTRCIVVCSRVYGKKANDTPSVLIQSDNWGGGAAQWAQWTGLMDHIRDNTTIQKVYVWSGDLHYCELNTPDDPLIEYELTSGPIMSTAHGAGDGLVGDWTTSVEAIPDTTRLYGYSGAPDGLNGDYNVRQYSIVDINGDQHGVTFYELNADGTSVALRSFSVGSGGVRNMGRGSRSFRSVR